MTSFARMLASPAPIQRHYPFGASTGYMSELRGQWYRQVEAASALSPFAVELSALAEPELDSLLDFLATADYLPFRYLSVHGPSKDRRMPESDLVEALLRLPEAIDAIVMHPDTITDPEPYRALGSRLVIENMDPRKQVGRTAEELQPIFAALPLAGFCFDIAHAYSIDESMDVAHDLLNHFGSRLRHVHLSSLSHDLRHIPLTREHESLFQPLLARCVDVPWILEAYHRPNL